MLDCPEHGKLCTGPDCCCADKHRRRTLRRGSYKGTPFWSLTMFGRRIFYWQGDCRFDGEGSRWQVGWCILPRLYLTAARWEYRWSRELKLHLDIGNGVPARRQLHLNYSRKGES